MTGVAVLLDAWRHTCIDDQASLVVPDGCRDLIAWQSPGQAPQWKLTPLMDRAEQVPGVRGQHHRGFRLCPGALVQAEALLAAVRGLDPRDTPGVMDRLHSFVQESLRVSDALLAIAGETGLAQARRQLGVGERTLERLLQRATGRSPVFWKRLARFRQVARDLDSSESLAQLASAHGFFDQAHLTRECRLWMGLTPMQLREQIHSLRLLREPGYG